MPDRPERASMTTEFAALACERIFVAALAVAGLALAAKGYDVVNPFVELGDAPMPIAAGGVACAAVTKAALVIGKNEGVL